MALPSFRSLCALRWREDALYYVPCLPVGSASEVQGKKQFRSAMNSTLGWMGQLECGDSCPWRCLHTDCKQHLEG